MKRVIILTVAILFASCAGDGQHPDFEKNVELSKKIYVTREDSNYRKIINEGDVVTLLRKKGWTVIRVREKPLKVISKKFQY